MEGMKYAKNQAIPKRFNTFLDQARKWYGGKKYFNYK
jgi:hypothetical protein